MSQELIEKIEQKNMEELREKQAEAQKEDKKKSRSDAIGEHLFEVGDTVDVHTRILEGDKERLQVFSGTVIARSGRGNREMFTVRRIVAGEGVERKFPVNSPKIAKIEVKRSSVVRRAKLYFLRDRVGKAVRLKERRKN